MSTAVDMMPSWRMNEILNETIKEVVAEINGKTIQKTPQNETKELEQKTNYKFGDGTTGHMHR
jgi:hypothetical protein